MNKQSTPHHYGEGGLDHSQHRKTFGWKPVYQIKEKSITSSPSSNSSLSTPVSTHVLSPSSVRSSNPLKSPQPYGTIKRAGSTLSLSQNPTPNTKELSHVSKRDRSGVSSPQPSHYGVASSSPSSSRLYGSISTTPVRNRPQSSRNQSSSKQVESQQHPQVSIKKAVSSPVFSHKRSGEIIPKDLLERLNSEEVIELTIQPERGSMSESVAPLKEFEELCNASSVMKIRNPITKIKDRIAELDVIVENARNALLKVIAIHNECIDNCERIEEEYVKYTLCVKHNKEVSSLSKVDLEKKHNDIIDVVGSLNSTYLSLKSSFSALEEECQEMEQMEASNKDLLQEKKEQERSLSESIESIRSRVRVLREEIEVLKEKTKSVLEEKKQRERVVHKKWGDLIASLEQEDMVIDRDEKNLLCLQQGKENEVERKMKELEQKKTQETNRESSLEKTHQTVSEQVDSLRATKQSLEKEVSEKETEIILFEHKLQQNQNQKDSLLELIKTHRETSEEEIRALKKAIGDLTTDYNQLRIYEIKLESEIKTVEFSIQEKQDQLTELEASKKQVNESTAEYQTRIERQKQDINSKKEEVNQLESLVNERNHRLQQLEKDVNDQKDLYISEKKVLTNRLNEQQYLHDHYEEIWEKEKKEKEDRIAFLKRENERLKQENEQLEVDVEELHKSTTVEEKNYLSTVQQLQQQLQQLQEVCQQREEKRRVLEQSVAVMEDLEKRASEGELIRRRLHNTLQELRGNLRVIARVRPLLAIDRTKSQEAAVWCENDSDVFVRYKNKVQHFSFDGCFGVDSTQSEVFDEVEHFVQSALDGYNVCLFTYGQTGSGKTYTMQGLGEGDERGIIPRSIEKIIDEIERLKDIGWEYEISVSYIEIYKELIRDLLMKNSGKLEIKLDINGHPYIPNITTYKVNSKRQIHSLMEIASSCRAVGATDMNDSSSRSHVVFTLYLNGVNTQKNLSVEGRLNLVDLAGSERLDRSHSTGEALEEAKFINRSLSALSNVFINIRSNSMHVNFRDTKLTLLLKDCLSKEGKTLMFVNLSPAVESAQESLCSLNFAATANQCKQGQAKRKVTRT